MTQLIRKKVVQEKLGSVSAMQVWRLANDPEYARLNFPKPRFIGRIPYWIESEIDSWIASRPTRSDAA